jgi:hypothetical protein
MPCSQIKADDINNNYDVGSWGKYILDHFFNKKVFKIAGFLPQIGSITPT